MYPRRKKSSGAKSGERGAQEIGPPLPIHLPLSFSFNYARTSLEKWEARHLAEKLSYY